MEFREFKKEVKVEVEKSTDEKLRNLNGHVHNWGDRSPSPFECSRL